MHLASWILSWIGFSNILVKEEFPMYTLRNNLFFSSLSFDVFWD